MLRPFWKIEEEYLAELKVFEEECERAENLQDALACGANEVYLDGEAVGWLYTNGELVLFDKFKNIDLSKIKVEFEELITDTDGYHDAYYKKVKE